MSESIISPPRLKQLLNTLRNMNSELAKYGGRAASNNDTEGLKLLESARQNIIDALQALSEFEDGQS